MLFWPNCWMMLNKWMSWIHRSPMILMYYAFLWNVFFKMAILVIQVLSVWVNLAMGRISPVDVMTSVMHKWNISDLLSKSTNLITSLQEFCSLKIMNECFNNSPAWKLHCQTKYFHETWFLDQNYCTSPNYGKITGDNLSSKWINV